MKLVKKKLNLWIILGIIVLAIIVILFMMSIIGYGAMSKCKEGDHECIKLANIEKYCKNDGECGCGTHIKTKECFFGNKNFVGPDLCDDFCSGFAGNMEIKCINNECKQVEKPRL